jgi:hypothetical protein
LKNIHAFVDIRWANDRSASSRISSPIAHASS